MNNTIIAFKLLHWTHEEIEQLRKSLDDINVNWINTLQITEDKYQYEKTVSIFGIVYEWIKMKIHNRKHPDSQYHLKWSSSNKDPDYL